MFSVLLGIFIGMEWLGPVAALCLTYRGTASGKESTCQGRRLKRHRFNPWVRIIPWSRKQQPTPTVLPGKFHGQTQETQIQSLGQDYPLE